MTTEQELINIQLESTKIMGFSHEAFTEREKILEPVQQWANDHLNKVLKKSNIDLEKFCLNNDRIGGETTLVDNDEIKIIAILDYDYGYSMGKIIIESKTSELVVRFARMFKKLD